MDTMDIGMIRSAPIKDFDQIVEKRAEKYELLRGRNNVTSCRSPTRDIDTKLIKDILKQKRHLEFQRRRPISPELHPLRTVKLIYSSPKRNHQAKTVHVKHHPQIPLSETQHEYNQVTSTSKGYQASMVISNSIKSDEPSTSKWASLWSKPLPLISQEKNVSFTSVPLTEESFQQNGKGEKTSVKTFIQTENIFQTEKSEKSVEKEVQREASVQTESGFVTVKALDIQQLADYLQEALWREEALKKKMATLQESASGLLKSSDKIWSARCNEDLLRNKVKSLEAQLQVCLQKIPKDGMKKLVLQMEKQKLMFEERALSALQKATEEKTEAVDEAQALQVAVKTVMAEASSWQDRYEKLSRNYERLRKCEELLCEQLQQLHSQLELSKDQEAELREEVGSLQRVIETLRKEIHSLKAVKTESWDFTLQVCAAPEGPGKDQVAQQRLTAKEKECVDLQTELEAMQQEYQSSQARLSQCREELCLLSQRNSSKRLRSTWWRMFVFFIVLLGLIGVAMLWLWHPPFRDHVYCIVSVIETRIQEYLMEMASPHHHFRPI